jgi:hypothetical protein
MYNRQLETPCPIILETTRLNAIPKCNQPMQQARARTMIFLYDKEKICLKTMACINPSQG